MKTDRQLCWTQERARLAPEEWFPDHLPALTSSGWHQKREWCEVQRGELYTIFKRWRDESPKSLPDAITELEKLAEEVSAVCEAFETETRSESLIRGSQLVIELEANLPQCRRDSYYSELKERQAINDPQAAYQSLAANWERAAQSQFLDYIPTATRRRLFRVFTSILRMQQLVTNQNVCHQNQHDHGGVEQGYCRRQNLKMAGNAKHRDLINGICFAREAKSFAMTIASKLDALSKPLFLNLIVDTRKHQVSRRGVNIPPIKLTGALWTMFSLVYEKGPQGATVGEIKQGMEAADYSIDNRQPTKNRLNKILKPLGVTLPVNEWRLVDM